MKRKILACAMTTLLVVSTMYGCVNKENSSSTENNTEKQTEQDSGNEQVNNGKFDIEVTYSDKEKLSVTKSDLSKYSNVIKLSNKTVTITESGEYVLSGKIEDGQIIVDVSDEDDKVVTLILNGVDVTSKNSAPIYVKNAKKVVLSLVKDTVNTFTDSDSYTYEDEEKEEPNACIFSKDDLVIAGNGTLKVTGNFNNGIYSKDDLTITGGKITVEAVNNGIKGKDSIAVLDTDITVKAGGDGMCTSNNEDEGKGFITIENGKFNIVSGEDGIHAETCMEIKNGNFEIKSGDDGIHGDETVTINNGDILISQCYEGIEATNVKVNDGNIRITATDDGFNAAGGNDGSSMNGRSGMNKFGGGTGSLNFSGGYIYVNTKGDGLDANGTIEVNGGLIIVDGPENAGNGALDFDGSFCMNAGYLLAVGYSGMAQMPTESKVNSVMIGLESTMNAGDVFSVQNSEGESVITFSPAKSYNNIVLCTAMLELDKEYTISIGGNVEGNIIDGVCSGAYTGGTIYETFTISETILTVGNATGGMGPSGIPGGVPGGMPGGQMPDGDWGEFPEKPGGRPGNGRR